MILKYIYPCPCGTPITVTQEAVQENFSFIVHLTVDHPHAVKARCRNFTAAVRDEEARKVNALIKNIVDEFKSMGETA